MRKVLIIILILSLVVPIYSIQAENEPIKVYVDGNPINFTGHPFIENGTTLVPFRPVFEALGLTVEWNATSKTVTGKKQGLEISLKLGNKIALVNVKNNELQVAPKIVSNTTFVPLRFIGEATGNQVVWDSVKRTVSIAGSFAPLSKTTASKGTVTRSFGSLVSKIKIASEYIGGYDRELFKHWINEDKNSCDTRDEVLISESLTPVTIGANCLLSGGSWYSSFDDVTTIDPSKFDIDHLVPLAEAWRSGAHAWDASTRQAYANDLNNKFSLIAVTASSNRSKGDKDPSSWLPPNNEYICEYVYMWIDVKGTWSLTADEKEIKKIKEVSVDCNIETLVFNPKPQTPTPTLKPTTTPTPAPSVSSTCEPNQVDINTAKIGDLKRIKYIGDARGIQMITLRPFKNVDDLIRISGIGPNNLKEIKAEGIACANE